MALHAGIKYLVQVATGERLGSDLFVEQSTGRAHGPVTAK